MEQNSKSLLRGISRHLAEDEHLRLDQLLDRILAEDDQLGGRDALMQCSGNRLSFRQLNERSNQLASRLMAKMTAGNDFNRIVAVCLPPSIEMIVSLLAIFKTGSAYLPLDSVFPSDRIAHILEDAKPILLVTSASVLESSPAFARAVERVPHFDVEETNSENGLEGADLDSARSSLAAVLYTSGSTGTPKGVRLEHKTILHRLRWQWRKFPYDEGEVACFKTSLTFVDSIAEIWGPLLAGKPLQIVPKEVVQDTERFISLLDECKITRLVLVPSLLKAILEILKSKGMKDTVLDQLKMWICSGEVLSSRLLLDFFQVFPSDKTMCNFYGSTEVMGDVTYASFESENQVLEAIVDSKVPIGIPVDNSIIYLLDSSSKELVQLGDIGEIYVSGLNVCSGYLNNREMERFVENHIEKSPGHETMFRTGDYGRLIHGQLYYEGRADSQIKIRGHRVDLNEINAVINQLEEVSFAVALCYKPGEPEQEIVAYVIPKPESCIESIKKHLKGKLLSYMNPKVMQIEEVPLLVNGKIDRQKLLRLYGAQQETKSGRMLCDESSLSRDETVLLRTVLSVIGGSPEIRLTDNFFEIGGNSLNAVAVVTKLRDQGFVLDLATFLSAERLEQLVPKLRSNVAPTNSLTPSYYAMEMLAPDFKHDVIQIIGNTFPKKNQLDQLAKVSFKNHERLLNELWEPLLKANLSFVLKNDEGKILAVALNFDLFDEPDLDLSKIGPELGYVLEFCDFIEAPSKEKFFEKRTKNMVHSFMMGTAEWCSPAENVLLIQQMEEENIKLAVRNGFSGIFTNNSSELTHQVCDELLGYRILSEFQTNQFVASDGTRPFAAAPDSKYVIVSVKYV